MRFDQFPSLHERPPLARILGSKEQDWAGKVAWDRVTKGGLGIHRGATRLKGFELGLPISEDTSETCNDQGFNVSIDGLYFDWFTVATKRSKFDSIKAPFNLSEEPLQPIYVGCQLRGPLIGVSVHRSNVNCVRCSCQA